MQSVLSKERVGATGAGSLLWCREGVRHTCANASVLSDGRVRECVGRVVSTLIGGWIEPLSHGKQYISLFSDLSAHTHTHSQGNTAMAQWQFEEIPGKWVSLDPPASREFEQHLAARQMRFSPSQGYFAKYAGGYSVWLDARPPTQRNMKTGVVRALRRYTIALVCNILAPFQSIFVPSSQGIHTCVSHRGQIVAFFF
jgi:hypothetical protein